MKLERRSWIVAATMLAALASVPAAADVKTGVDLWQANNYVGAVKEWRPLADKGNADAQFNMGQAYKLGLGVPQDLKIAQSWFEKAAAQKHEQAQANLAIILFQNGNRAAAMPLLKKAAERGNPRARYLYGTALFNGDVVAKDWPRAYALMTSAASAGLAPAAESLAQMDKYMSEADRKKGIALLAQTDRPDIAKSPTPAQVARANAAAAAKPPRVAGAVPAAKPAAPSAKPAPAVAGGWRVQLGAYGSASAAQGQWAALSKKIGALSGMQPSYEAAGKFTRLRVGPLASRAAADKLCASAKAAGQACFPVAP
jgi:uncharacterized protein